MLERVSLFVVVGLLCGCADTELRVTSAGSPVQSVQALQAVDLPLALNPGQLPANGDLENCLKANAVGTACAGLVTTHVPNLLQRLNGATEPTRDRAGANGPALERLRLEAALDAFYETDPVRFGSAEDRRTRLQQRLIAASNTNCGIFADNLYATQATTNALFGTAATALGGAGSIVTGVDAARLLSGLSGLATGFRAELNQDYFRNLWVEALLKAIDTNRDQLRSDMDAHKTDTISQYPVEEAIADAIRYNNACSLVAGLEQVNQAVVIAADPVGLKAFHDVYSRAGFNPTFDLSINSNGQSNRLAAQPATAAAASAALQEISGELALARIADDEATKAITANTPTDKQSAANAALAAAFGRVSATDSTNLLQPYVAQLTTLQTAYAGYVTDLGNASTQQAHDDVVAEMRTNDGSADVVRRAALELIHDTESQMSDIVTQYAPPPAPAPATQPKKP